ncbi:MAG TPA: hypothetical protein VFQ85_18690 [Mycobacteriales bacterium]|jgi:hypothetical protein|nr:hypothetical protein [Mycobacteriales bacterium]
MLRKTLALAAVATPLLMMSTSANAGAAGFSVTGTGALAPGIPTTGCAFQTSVAFDGTLSLAAGSGHAGTYDVHFRGSSTNCETLLNGTGSGTLSGGVSGNVQYSRNVQNVTLTGSAVVDGHNHTITADCTVVITSANPFASFVLTCEGAIS